MTTPADPEHSHYPWGPSASKTWRTCQGSINYVTQEKAAGNIPAEEESSFAAEGTRAHDYAEKFLTGQTKTGDIPDEFLEHLQGYFDLAAELATTIGGGDCVVMNEQQVPLYYAPAHTGTLDYGVVAEDGSEVAILDLKYGMGVYVAAENNDQLAIYALSLMSDLTFKGYTFTDDTTVSMLIHQPRHREFTGAPEIWETTYRDLLDLGIDIEADYKASVAAPTDLLKPSEDACRFCDARVICRARVVDLFEDVPEETNLMIHKEPDLPAITQLDDAARVAIFKHHKAIAKWMTDVVSDSLLRIEQGGTIEGLKSVDGKAGNRTWGENAGEVSKLCRKIPTGKRYKARVLLSPAQLEKVLKTVDKPLKDQSTKFKGRWEEMICRRGSTPSLALEEDEKPARLAGPDFDVEVTPEDCF
jgi:hypothetical protein